MTRTFDGLEKLTYTVPQAAAALQVSERHLYYLVKRGDIPTLTGVGRRTLIAKTTLARWVEQASQLPAQPETGTNTAHAGPDAPATGGAGRDEQSQTRGDLNVACAEDHHQIAAESGSRRTPAA